jgi:hypothetical protein
MSSLLRIGLLLVLGLVLLARAMEYMNDRISAASRPSPQAMAEARAVAAEAAAENAPVPPPPPPIAKPGPTDTQLQRLQLGDADAVDQTLRELRHVGSTPELQAALTVAASRATAPLQRRAIACLRGRDPATPFAALIAELPPTDARNPAWRQEPTRCLVDVIAARAAEDPARTVPLLADCALVDDRLALTEGLRRLPPQPLPATIVQILTHPPATTREVEDYRTRLAAVRVAVALGAAETAPPLVAAALDDGDRGVRDAALRMLRARGDDASLIAAAGALAASPGDDALEKLAIDRLRQGGALERHLVAVAADLGAPPFARAQAAHLVSEAGSEPAARVVAALTSADATLQPELQAAAQRVRQRFGAREGR